MCSILKISRTFNRHASQWVVLIKNSHFALGIFFICIGNGSIEKEIYIIPKTVSEAVNQPS